MIRAAGDVGNAIAGRTPAPPPGPSSPWSELLRHAEEAGLHDHVRQFLEGETQSGRPQPDPSMWDELEDDDVVEREAEVFDAWALAGIDTWEE